MHYLTSPQRAVHFLRLRPHLVQVWLRILLLEELFINLRLLDIISATPYVLAHESGGNPGVCINYEACPARISTNITA